MSTPFTRRDFFRWASAGAGAAAAGAAVWRLGAGEPPTSVAPTGPRSTTPTTLRMPVPTVPPSMPPDTAFDPGPAPAPSPSGDRRLVVIELNGGNDGLSTLVPYGLGAYYDLRTETAIGGDLVIPVDGEFGYHSALGRLSSRPLAAVQGVGSHSPDLSHFEMLRRWWAGDPDGSGGYDTGILGRLADLVGDPAAPAVAISIGAGSTPALVSRSVSTLSLPNADAIGYLTGASADDALRYAFQQGFERYSPGGAGGIIGRIRDVGRQTTNFARALDGMATDDAVEYPGSTLGNGLRLAADLVAADNGVRIVHVPMGSDFDTHENHRDRHAALLDELDQALDAFLGDLERRGIADRVLVMTTSEFGRRPGDKGINGLDHGTASTAFLAGPVVAGRHGEHPSLTSLDGDDNLIATLGLDGYFATVAEGWFGVPGSELFSSAPEVLGGLFV